MKKQIITEINRMQEMMGISPTKRILTEGGTILRVYRKVIEKFGKKVGGNADLDDLFSGLLLNRKGGGWDMGEWERMMASGTNQADLIDSYPNPQTLVDDLGNDFYSPQESEALLRVLTRSQYMEELVEALITNPKTFKEFQTLFPSGTVGSEGKGVLAKALNQDPEDEFISYLTTRLNQTLKKIPIKIPFTGGKVIRVPVPFLFRKGWWTNFGNKWKFRTADGSLNKRWVKAGWLFGILSVGEFVSRVFPSWTGLGDIYGGGGIKKDAFSRSFYDDKMMKKEGDDNWIERNKLENVDEIIQSLRTAGVGKAMDIGVDDDEIIRIYKEDIKNGECGPTYFQASQVATEWYRQTNGNLHEDILKSMNFPIKNIGFSYGAELAALIINAVAGTHIDWTDVTIVEFYEVFDLYYDDCDAEGNNTRKVQTEIFSNEEKQNMFRLIPSYPKTLKHERKTYCSTWSGKIHPLAWITLAQDKPNHKDAKNYIRNMDAEEFNDIHESIAPGMGIIYEISEDEKSSGCGAIEKQTIDDYVGLFNGVHNQIKKELKITKEDGDK
tara:strand:- start:1008 stop:2669 length:1662 start_codon:yes stop_codon:yes gene_type:complete